MLYIRGMIFLILMGFCVNVFCLDLVVKKQITDSGNHYKVTYVATKDVEGIGEVKEILRQKTYDEERLLMMKESKEAELAEINEILRVIKEFKQPGNAKEIIIGNIKPKE